ncbi:MAG: hypothetical protein NUV84_00245 [Candidatus Uhrbacteria bacterium]|nr:hypothetical protein [Candidatus Uhrbacteria bacterium]
MPTKKIFLLLLLSSMVAPQAVGAMQMSAYTNSIPTIAKITPNTGVTGQTVTYSAMVTDNDVLESCSLYIDGEWEKYMMVKRDVVYATLEMDDETQMDLYAKCTDTDGNIVTGATTEVTVSDSSTYVDPDVLIKLACEGDVYPNDPCTSVYYYGVDGKRHAFPTEAVFSSWFNDFDDLVILSDTVMANIPLGKNVTFRPGERMVKFSTNTVYAVSYAGVLRPIANADIAEVLFGGDWVSMIEIVDDVFYGNYRIGATVESSSSFSWSAAKSSTTIIDHTF